MLIVRLISQSPIRCAGACQNRGMVMFDALAIALATVAVGIPAIVTAAALGSKLGLHW
jgi:hypothetical protein